MDEEAADTVADSTSDPAVSVPERGFGSPSPADGVWGSTGNGGAGTTNPVDTPATSSAIVAPTASTTARLPATTAAGVAITENSSTSNNSTTSPPETRGTTSSAETTILKTAPSSTTPVTSTSTTSAPAQTSTTAAAPSTTSTPTSTTNGQGTATRLLATADIGQCNDDAAQRVGNLAETLEGQLVAVGDIAYPDGTLSEIQECFGEPFRAVLDRVIPVSGNHEYHTPDAAGWKQFFGRTDTYYTTQLGPWKLIVLDTECDLIGGCGANDPQQQWLQSQLATAPLCTAVAMHRPYRVSSNYDRQGHAEVLHQIVVDADVDVLLTGHEHIYEHLKFGNTHQFVVGTGGAGLRSAGTPMPESQKIVEGHHGLLALDLAADSFSWQFLDTGSTVHDSGSATCS